MRSNDLFQRITRQIADAIAAGAPSFEMPWHKWGEGTQPINTISGRPYRGVNTILLWAAAEQAGYSSGRWATFRQWSEAGAQVRKGEKSTFILFWKTAANDDSGSDESDDHSTDARPRFIARAYAVFNEHQVDGAEPAALRPTLSHDERIAAAEDFIAATGAQIRHGGDRAYYAPGSDQVWLPQFEQFKTTDAYYSVALHELTHWSGAKSRLNRDLKNRFGSEAYAAEELVAELGSAFLAAHLGITLEPRPDHAAYIASWLKILDNDSRAILTASSKAQEAADYLIGLSAAAAAEEASPDRSPELALVRTA